MGTAEELPDGSPAEELRRSVTTGDVEATLLGVTTVGTLRYHDRERDRIAELVPERGVWVQPNISLSNLGDGSIDRKEIADFLCFSETEGWLYPPIDTFDRIEYTDLRPRDRGIVAPDLENSHKLDGDLAPGASFVYVPLFDVPEGDRSYAWGFAEADMALSA